MFGLIQEVTVYINPGYQSCVYIDELLLFTHVVFPLGLLFELKTAHLGQVDLRKELGDLLLLK